jgi:nucleoside-diphosphate-sugar epimerase
LEIGNISSYRNIIHVSDVVSAISVIIKQTQGDTYLICNEHIDTVQSYVEQMYESSGLTLIKKENNYIEKDTNLKVLIINNTFSGIDITPTKIHGNPAKLKNLGWIPKVSIPDILNEYIE